MLTVTEGKMVAQTNSRQTGAMDYTSIEWNHVALILIDVQNDFVDEAMPVAGAREVLSSLADLVTAFRVAARPIVHAIRLYEPGSSDADPIRRASIERGDRVVAPGTIGAHIPVELTGGHTTTLDCDALLAGQPQPMGPDEVITYKPRWSAFFRTDRHTWLADRGVTSVLVAGCNLPNCPRATLFDATERDLRAAVVEDAISQATPTRLADLELIGVQRITLAQIHQELG